ncbi:MAG: hypothetical protein AB7V36_04175 [Bacteroidales bacterium]
MKKIFVFLCMLLPLVVFSQRPAKVFLKILDVYLKNELPRLNYDEDDILVHCRMKIGQSDYYFYYSVYNLEQLPEVDSMKMYKGVRMLVSYPKEMEKKLSRHFKPIIESREVQEDAYMMRIDPVSEVTIQMNEKYEIYYFITKDDISYYNKLKKKRIKFSEKVISCTPLPEKR